MSGASFVIKGIAKDNSEHLIRTSDHSLSIIETKHRLNHDGLVFTIPYFKTVAASSNILMWFYMSSTIYEAHMYVDITSDNSGYIDVWKGTVSATSQWASITPINLNGESTHAASLVAFTGGVVSSSINTLYAIKTVGSDGRSGGGGGASIGDEIILENGSTYMVRFVCTSTEADVAFNINYYEHKER